MPDNLSLRVYEHLDFRLPLVLSVSGGKDSVAMFHLVTEFINSFSKEIEVIHFNHGLRKESRSEEEFVRKMAASKNLPVKVFYPDVRKRMKEKKESLEEAARYLRYEALTQYTSKKPEKGLVYTAHTASDQAETLIFRLIKGAGRPGMEGIKRELELESGWLVKRPLLDITQEEIKKFLKDNSLGYCVDPSNFDLGYPRNFIRHKIIKDMMKINPSVEKSLVKISDIWRSESEFLDEETEQRLGKVRVEASEDKICIELYPIISYNKWLQRRILRRLSPVEMDFNQTELLVDMLEKPGVNNYIYLNKNWRARKEYDNLILEKSLPEKSEFEYSLELNGSVNIPETGVKVKTEVLDSVPENLNETDSIEYFDLDGIRTESLKVRSRKDGDRLRLWGLGGSKKIKDLFIDMKLRLQKRQEAVVVEDGEKILWVAPYRRSDAAPVSSRTRKILKIELL